MFLPLLCSFQPEEESCTNLAVRAQDRVLVTFVTYIGDLKDGNHKATACACRYVSREAS